MEKFERRFLGRLLLCFLFAAFVASAGYGQNPFAIDEGVINKTSSSNLQSSYTEEFSDFDEHLEYLTDEERRFLSMGLLPSYYPILKQCFDRREPYTGAKGGLAASVELCKSFYPMANGHFSRNFGDVQRMLTWARKVDKNDKMREIVLNCRVGDVILTGPEGGVASGDASYYITLLTKGPFSHATIIIETMPPVIIEAMGATGTFTDPCSNKVRMTMWYEELHFNGLVKLVRPTLGMDKHEAQGIINNALSYAHEQLGKPYDYAFTDDDGTDAFYCSELVSKAYSAAGLDIASKNADRDKVIVAIHAVIDGLDPIDKSALADEIVNFAVNYIENPSFDMLQDFIVNTLVPSCRVFSKMFPGEEGQARLDNVITKVRTGEAFASFTKAQKSYNEQKASGKFDAKFGIGFMRKTAAKAAVATGLMRDMGSLVSDAGTNIKDTITLTGKIILPLYKNLGTCAEVLSQLGKNGMEMPKGVDTILEITQWAVDKREEVKKWPVIGEVVAGLMPGSGDGNIRTDFTSPSDLAYASRGFNYSWP